MMNELDIWNIIELNWLTLVIKLHFIRYNNKMAHYGRAEYWEERYSKDA